jgi:hypothetical protein
MQVVGLDEREDDAQLVAARSHQAMTVGGVLADLLPAQRCTAGQCVIVAKGGECGEHPEHGLMSVKGAFQPLWRKLPSISLEYYEE